MDDVIGETSAGRGETPDPGGVPIGGWAYFGGAALTLLLALAMGAMLTGSSYSYRLLSYGLSLAIGAMLFVPLGITSLVIAARGTGRASAVLLCANLAAILAQLIIVASLFTD